MSAPAPPAFTLWKSTSAANRAQYLGHVILPDGRTYAIEASVVEHDKGDGSGAKGKHFEGRVLGGDALVKHMLKGAKAEGTLPPDLVSLMQQAVDPDDSAQFEAETKTLAAAQAQTTTG